MGKREYSMTNIPINEYKPQTTALAELVIIGFSAIVTVFTLAWMLWYCRYGFDLTDDSFYIVWMSNPFNYSLSETQFGFIYYPLYGILDGSRLRQPNIMITLCLS